MECSRCGGLMVEVMLEDRESTFLPCVGIQCVSCGDIVDEVIAQHRVASVKPPLRTMSVHRMIGMNIRSSEP
jgi:bacterioferritin-associated ferredoxin